MTPSSELLSIINHVFLPPKLPQNDQGGGFEDVALLLDCERAWESFQSHSQLQEASKAVGCSTMLRNMIEMRDSSGMMVPEKVEAMLESMSQKGTLAFYIRGQNAALIIQKLEKQYSFVSFELSPTNKAVMSTKGRLRRYFPGPAISVDEDRMMDPPFLEALVQTIATLDVQTPAEALPQVSSPESETIDVQDTAHPKFLTEMLFGILRGIGKPVDVPRIEKRTRDDVLWDGAAKPWRRSPMWLLIRVAFQIGLAMPQDPNHTHYKSFMAFFMGRILQRCLNTSVSSELLFAMSAKISRRLLKLGLGNDVPWIQDINNLTKFVQQELHARWAAIEQNPDPFQTQTGWDPLTLSFSQDTSLSLQNLGPYLRAIPFRDEAKVEKLDFIPQCLPRIEQFKSSFPAIEIPDSEIEIRLWLADIEIWVEDNLIAWLRLTKDSRNSTTLLSELIESYTASASATYTGNPEAISLMLLTAMDMWVALDKCAIYQCPILSQYNPEFPESIFDHLLLPKRSQMERLHKTEEYLRQRRYLITTSVFQSVSFASQFYEQSPRHQQLRRRIEIDAQEDRNRKKAELKKRQQRYSDLMRDSEARTCEYGTHIDRGRVETHHSPNCRKCQIRWEANRIEIEVHEWPLPLGEYAIKAAVFELEVPTPLADWRNATYLLLVDIFSPPESLSQTANEDKVYCMKDYSGLRSYAKSKSSRIQLASTSKSFLAGPSSSKPVSGATEHNVCISNGLVYSTYDTKLKRWTKDILGCCDVRNLCTLQLPPGSYQQLQSTLAGTKHSSNDILAMQSMCPESINLHEFYAFGTLRCGNRLQWRNIARELVSRVLDFSREETHLLILQAAWEVGRPGDGGIYRDSHVDLKEEDFGTSLLVVLNESLGAVEGSWQGAVATRTFVALALRALSMSPCKIVQSECFSFLRRARDVSLNWMRQVRSFLDETEDLDALTDLNIRVLEMALTCHETFDVERCHASETLSSAKNIATIVECSITIHDHCPAVTADLPQPIKRLLERFARRSQLLEPYILHQILQDQQGIDETIRRIWAGYRPSGVWNPLPSPNDRWLETTTHDDRSYSRLTVHYNVLDGRLLVNGLPLTRLPQEYQLHPTYRRFFGDKVLTVVPSSMVGMEFEMRSGLLGQQIHFSMITSELIIRTRNEDQVYELIPSKYLETDFPKALVQDYAHWLNVATGSIEFRSVTQVWEPSERWLVQADKSRNYKLLCDGKSLVDIRSQTVQAVSRILSPLDDTPHIHILHDNTEEELIIHLPRYKLDFFLRKTGGALESKQFRGMIVDEAQSIGTLAGLVNKLVLRSVDGNSRIVVVPQGAVIFAQKGHHVRVTINTDGVMQVHHHAYTIDNQLGRLIDNGSLQSRLFRIYLHATTSHCLIDRLTGRTGTEEALDCLASAGTRSFVELEPTEVHLLELIAQLTPRRQFFPENVRESQQVDWLDIHSLSQHGAFQKLVGSIFDQACSSHIFQDHPTPLPVSKTRGMQHLLDRASIRDSLFRVEGYGAECHITECDVVYSSRDQAPGSYRELQTCNIARLVDNWSQNLVCHAQLLQEIESWGEPIRPSVKQDPVTLGFDTKWLESPSKFLPSTLYAFHHQLSNTSRERDKYKVMMLLSTLAYSEHAKQELVQTLLAFATVPELRRLDLPNFQVLCLSDGYAPLRQRMVSVVETFIRPFDECPESKLVKLPGETRRMAERRREDEYHLAKDQQMKAFVGSLMALSSSRNLSDSMVVEMNSHIRVDEATEALRPWFESWQRNAHFQKRVEEIQSVLDGLASQQNIPEPYKFSSPPNNYLARRTHIRFIDLVENAPPHYVPGHEDEFHTWVTYSQESAADNNELAQLLVRVTSRSSSKHDEQYAADLYKSYNALRGDSSEKLTAPDLFVRHLTRHLKHTQRQESHLYKLLCTHLESGEWHTSRQSHMLPRLSKLSILSQLASDNIGKLPPGWRQLFIHYGLSVLALQRAGRLLASAGNPVELLSELRNSGHRNWDPIDHPQWLLIEIENNILIRKEQSQVAHEMISPSSGSNSVLQLSMGLGKSSVIIPVAAATLADKTKLVRVIVLKPLAMQMFNILRQKLGGLLNRRIFYMPITRSLKLDPGRSLQIHKMLQECMLTGGVLLMQPEHILSFELMGFEKLLSNNIELGTGLTRTQEWLEKNSRDIIDESDEILSVKYELIYTMGMQQSSEFSPDRWNIIQEVLKVLGKHAHEVKRSFPDGLEVTSLSSAFPRVRIIQAEAGDALINIIARQVCEHGIPGVPVWRLPRSTRKALFKFLVAPTWSLSARESFHDFVSGSKSVESALLLLKGLFGKGVLKFCLMQKRWRVHYGLHLSRTKLAVPYHAKDSPAPRAEFSHPDATIVLTCLSYYYGGLSDEQMLASFEALLQSDHASEEYAHWVQEAQELPVAFRQLTGINLGNLRQCQSEVFPPLRFTTRIINFYMSNIVFPPEMKEFPQKLSSSGWDIAREKHHPTTGFSGTNDSRYHLPLSIGQRDFPEQLSTNAGVLGRVLRPENIVADVSQVSITSALGATALIKMASMLDPPARVILDVGAQVLELENENMAQKWLSNVPGSEAQAVVFFDTRNDICVLSRDGSKELLEVSPFLKQMDACLVYLDEAHTRGTDLKMPGNYRAIVTLGPDLTKDRLVQACMRMRKLGEGQSVAFCGSNEITTKIQAHTGKSGRMIEITDVLEWCISNTCAYARKSIPLWATQGLRFQRRHVICSKPLSTGNEVSDKLVKYLPEQEAQSLQERYGDTGSNFEAQFNNEVGLLQGRERQLAEIKAKCEEFDVSSFNMASLYEEQERELSPENERERQVDRPPVAIPRKHALHLDVQDLATQGVLRRSSDAFIPAFEIFRDTAAGKYFEAAAWPKDLLVTKDFANTVQSNSEQKSDSYLRPVNWAISYSEGSNIGLVIISPFEAQELLPSIRKWKKVNFHVYAPCLNLSARKLDDLSFCAISHLRPRNISSSLPRLLNIFAGQLYIKDYEEYIALCSFLGLSSRPPEGDAEVGADGFVKPGGSVGRQSPFKQSPVEFLRATMGIRRKGVEFGRGSHLGMIVNGELIGRERFVQL